METGGSTGEKGGGDGSDALGGARADYDPASPEAEALNVRTKAVLGVQVQRGKHNLSVLRNRCLSCCILLPRFLSVLFCNFF